jgi:hypothetical protein
MNELLIASIALEGGGADIYGKQDGGVWSFWMVGSSIGQDRDEGEDWRSWSSEPVPRLEDALPRDWVLFSPVKVHPDFVAWFREAYRSARAALSDEMEARRARHTYERWVRVLGLNDHGGP